jgi:hypothetical protein
MVYLLGELLTGGEPRWRARARDIEREYELGRALDEMRRRFREIVNHL